MGTETHHLANINYRRDAFQHRIRSHDSAVLHFRYCPTHNCDRLRRHDRSRLPSHTLTNCRRYPISITVAGHRIWSAVPHVDTYGKNNILTRGQQVLDIDTSSAVDLVLHPGQMSLHHPWLVHSSQPNRSGSRRVGVEFQSYLGAAVRPTRGQHRVMHVHGQPVGGSFVEAPRPTETCNAHGLGARAAAEAAYADVMYADAAHHRGL